MQKYISLICVGAFCQPMWLPSSTQSTHTYTHAHAHRLTDNTLTHTRTLLYQAALHDVAAKPYTEGGSYRPNGTPAAYAAGDNGNSAAAAAAAAVGNAAGGGNNGVGAPNGNTAAPSRAGSMNPQSSLDAEFGGTQFGVVRHVHASTQQQEGQEGQEGEEEQQDQQQQQQAQEQRYTHARIHEHKQVHRNT